MRLSKEKILVLQIIYQKRFAFYSGTEALLLALDLLCPVSVALDRYSASRPPTFR
jgi:hypothetical protein